MQNSTIYRLVGQDESNPAKMEAQFGIKLVDVIIDKVKGENGQWHDVQRKIRHIPTMGTIFEDEQLKINPKVTDKDATTLWFIGGKTFVNNTDLSLKKFLEMSNYSADKKDRDFSKRVIWYENNPAKKAREFVDKERAKANLNFRAANMDMESAMILAQSIAKDVAEFKRYTEADPAEIQQLIISFAAKDPDKFIERLNDEDTRTRGVLLKAINDSLIYFNPVTRAFSWKEDGGIILTCPISMTTLKDSLDYFITMINNMEEVELVFQDIKKLVKNDVATQMFKKGDRDEEMLKEAIELKVIKAKGAGWYEYNGKKLGQGLPKLLELVKEDGDLRLSIDDDIRKAQAE